MKYLFFILFLGASSLCQAQDIVLAEDYIKVKFDKKTTQDDLDSIKKDLQQKNIDIQYSNLEFKGKKLKGIAFKVDCNDGYSGSASSKHLLVAPIGFTRDYRKGSQVSFTTGTIK